MTIREYRLQQLKNLKDMTTRDKVAYIAQYFGAQILLVVAVLAIGIFFVVKIATEKDPALSIACINAIPNSDRGQNFVQEYADYAGINLDKMEVRISTDLICTDEDDMVEENYQSIQRLMAQLTAKELDVLVSDMETIASYMYQDVFFDLTDVLTPEQQIAYGDKFLFVERSVFEKLQQDTDTYPPIPDPTKPQEMEDPVPMALRLPGDSEFVDRYFHYYSADVYLGVVLNAQNVDNVLAFIDFIYGAGN